MIKTYFRALTVVALLVVFIVPSASHAAWKNFEQSISIGNISSVGQVLGEFSGLTESQIQAILSLLASFGADQSIINSVNVALGGSPTNTTTPSTVGALVASLDASSPSYALVAGGTTNAPIGAFKFRATGEHIMLKSIRFYLLSTASPSDITRLTLWNGATQVGEAYFVGNSYGTVATLTTPVKVYKDTDTVITVKADIATIGTGQPGKSGDLIQIGMQFGFGDFYGVGETSGTTIQATGSNASVAGIRTMKSFPIVNLDSLSVSGLEDGRLIRFKVAADSHSAVSLGKVFFTVQRGSVIISNVKLYGYTDSNYSSPISGQGVDGGIPTEAVGPGYYINSSSPIQIPAGSTRYFELRGSVSNAASGSVVVTKLDGDSVYPGLGDFVVQKEKGYFVWSPNSFTISTFTTQDWTNGYGVPGLPPTGISQTRIAGDSSSTGLTESNIQSILDLLRAFGASDALLSSAESVLRGNGGTKVTHSLTNPQVESILSLLHSFGANASIIQDMEVLLKNSTSTNQTNPVVINAFTSSASSVTSGQAITLSWSSNLTSTDIDTNKGGCSISVLTSTNQQIHITNFSGASGFVSYTPTITGNYTLTCTSGGKDGSPLAKKTLTVNVGNAPVSTDGPKYNAKSCSSPSKSGLATGVLACYGLWDFGNEFGNDQNMCDETSYGTPKTGCKVSTSACTSGSATATRVIDTYAPWHNSAAQLATQSDLQSIANNLLSSVSIIESQLVRVWEYTCDASQATVVPPTFVEPIVVAAPTCSLSASATYVPAGGQTVLKWSSSHATSFTINQAVGAVSPVSSGSKIVTVSGSKTYTATAKGDGGSKTCSVAITTYTPYSSGGGSSGGSGGKYLNQY